MANFSPGRNFSPATEKNSLKIKLSITRRGVQPGLKKISCNRNRISALAEKQETMWLPLGSRSDLGGIKAIK